MAFSAKTIKDGEDAALRLPLSINIDKSRFVPSPCIIYRRLCNFTCGFMSLPLARLRGCVRVRRFRVLDDDDQPQAIKAQSWTTLWTFLTHRNSKNFLKSSPFDYKNPPHTPHSAATFYFVLKADDFWGLMKNEAAFYRAKRGWRWRGAENLIDTTKSELLMAINFCRFFYVLMAIYYCIRYNTKP